MGRKSDTDGHSTCAVRLCLRRAPGHPGKLILLWVVSSPTSCSIDFSLRIHYRAWLQTSLRWTEGKMMFSFQWSLLVRACGSSGGGGQDLFILSVVSAAWHGLGTTQWLCAALTAQKRRSRKMELAALATAWRLEMKEHQEEAPSMPPWPGQRPWRNSSRVLKSFLPVPHRL